MSLFALENGVVVTAPRLGDPISPGGDLAYVKRASAQSQASKWNSIIRQYEKLHPDATGLEVGVAPMQVDRRFALVWVRAPGAAR
jgi:hypothetical protein